MTKGQYESKNRRNNTGHAADGRPQRPSFQISPWQGALLAVLLLIVGGAFLFFRSHAGSFTPVPLTIPTARVPRAGAPGTAAASTQPLGSARPRASLGGALPSASTPCASSSPSGGAYTVQVCLTAPAAGTAVSGDVTVTAELKQTGTTPGIRRVLFSLDGQYLLTDYQQPYTFTLPTSQWADGPHALSAAALTKTGATTQQATLLLRFNNGSAATPSNSPSFGPTSGRPAQQGAPFVVVATGDGASGEDTAGAVVKRIAAINPNLLLYLGDVYEEGTFTELFNWYGSGSNNFSAFRAITDPTVGNHEYLTSGARGYFDYWGKVPSYYSFNAGGWHFVSLNSNNHFESDAAGSTQYDWLKQDLAARAPGQCTIAYYHHPLFNIGPEGASQYMDAIWKLLADSGVTIVLNGHDHDYQRWNPLDGNGTPNASGMTEFVVGSGGHGLQPFVHTDPRLAFSADQVPSDFGVLTLQLDAGAASFQFINAAGAVLDSGRIPCP